MPAAPLEEEHASEIVSVCRTSVGDELRSITFFTEDELDQLYLRSDLERTADLMGFADLERMGFHSQAAYSDSQLGAYQGTVRMFENGFLTRVIHDDIGVWITTDGMSMERFEELAIALDAVLEEINEA